MKKRNVAILGAAGNLVKDGKAYKLRIIEHARMFPSDPIGSLDVFFLFDCLKFGKRF